MREREIDWWKQTLGVPRSFWEYWWMGQKAERNRGFLLLKENVEEIDL